MKAIFIEKILGDVYPDDLPSEYWVGFSHSHKFGPGGDFTACGGDLASYPMDTKEVDLVDCPICIIAMEKTVRLCKGFKVKR